MDAGLCQLGRSERSFFVDVIVRELDDDSKPPIRDGGGTERDALVRPLCLSD